MPHSGSGCSKDSRAIGGEQEEAQVGDEEDAIAEGEGVKEENPDDAVEESRDNIDDMEDERRWLLGVEVE